MFDIDKEKFGEFIAELRKEKGYTQKELADKLFLSNKAISKWETEQVSLTQLCCFPWQRFLMFP